MLYSILKQTLLRLHLGGEYVKGAQDRRVSDLDGLLPQFAEYGVRRVPARRVDYRKRQSKQSPTKLLVISTLSSQSRGSMKVPGRFVCVALEKDQSEY
jgi:hypothetical protein